MDPQLAQLAAILSIIKAKAYNQAWRGASSVTLTTRDVVEESDSTISSEVTLMIKQFSDIVLDKSST